jgi:hypothetical protein
LHNVCESGLLSPGNFPFLVFAMLTTSLGVNCRRAVTTAPASQTQPLWYEDGLELVVEPRHI